MQENYEDQGDSLSRSDNLETLEILPDRYQYQKILGNKAGRTTVLAVDRQTENQVVVKLLTFSDEFQWEDLRLFERETATLRSLDHPSIPKYLDSFEMETNQGKSIALVQSYIPAQSLEEYLLAGRQFDETEVRELLNSLLDILVYLHDRHPPVIHRDLKPSNILLGNRSGNSIGQVYLVDFGSVQTLATRAGQTMTVVGTYGYMPPEQFGGSAVPASDLYSLGCTALRLITGSHPGDLPQRNLQIQFAQYTDLSPSFTAWLQKATHPSLDQRFSQALTAKEILNQSPELDGSPLALSSSGKSLIRKQKNWNFIWRNTAMGTLAGSFSGTFFGIQKLYEPYFYYGNMGLAILWIVSAEIIIGFSLGLISGVVSALSSNYLSTKDKYYSHKLGLIISGGSVVSLTLFASFRKFIFSQIVYESLENSTGKSSTIFLLESLSNFMNLIPYDSSLGMAIRDGISIIYRAMPILFFALAMGWISYSGARWYQKQLASISPQISSEISPKVSIDKKLVVWNFILRSTAIGTLLGVSAGLAASYILSIFVTYEMFRADYPDYLLKQSLEFISDAGSGGVVGFILGLTNGVTAAVNTLSSSNHGKGYPLKSGLIGTAVGLFSAASMNVIASRNNMEAIIPLSSIALILGVIASSNARWYQKQIEE